MRIEIDTELEGLGEILADVLPAGTRPTALRIASDSLRLEARAPIVGGVALVARVQSSKGRLRLSDLDVEGSALIRKPVLAALRKAIASLDARAGRFHVRGDRQGAALVLTWK